VPKKPPNAHVIALLSLAIAILAEEMNTTGTKAPPKTAAKRRARIDRLRSLTSDAAVLAEACDVLLRRTELDL
jgi:hypothetical protein